MPPVKLTASAVAKLEARDGKLQRMLDQSLPGFAVRLSPSGQKHLRPPPTRLEIREAPLATKSRPSASPAVSPPSSVTGTSTRA